MNTTNSNSKRRFWYWLTLVPLVCGASFALLNYAFWASAYGDWYGLPSYAWRLMEARHKAHFYWWMLTVLTLTATILATILVPPLKSEALPGALKVLGRFALAVLVVLGSIFIVTYGMSAAGHYLK